MAPNLAIRRRPREERRPLLAGAGRDAARDAVTAALSHAGLAESIEVGTDVEAAFHDAFGEGPGVMLIAGTGSIAWARDEGGVMHRVGGWGQHVGDEGSGYWLVMEALRRVASRPLPA